MPLSEDRPFEASGPGAMDYFPRLDGVRGIAALMVAGSHAAQLWTPNGGWDRWSLNGLVPSTLLYGWSGVVLFFVLSGWLISLPFWQSAGADWADYARRRLGRIAPLLWAQVLLFSILLALSLPTPGLEPNADLADVAWQMSLTFRLWPQSPGPWMSVWWTLPLELSFYLTLPLLFLLNRSVRWPVLVLLLLAAPALRAAMAVDWLNGAWSRVLINLLPARFDLFLIGVMAAGIWVHRRHWFERLPAAAWRWGGAIGLWLLVLVSVLMAIASPVAIPRSWPLAGWQTLFAVFSIAWIVGCCLPGSTDSSGSRGVTGRWALRWMGRLSYSIYLWHFPLMMLLRPWMREWVTAPWQLPVALLLALLPILLISYLSWRLIEEPGRAWFRKWRSPPRPAANRPADG